MARSVLLVDDHPGFRRMVRLLLGRGGCDVVGEAGTAADAIDPARELEPDLVLLDMLLPDGNGVYVAERLAALPHPPGVVLTSSYGRGGLGERLGSSLVLGSLPKDAVTAARLAELFG